MFLSNIFRITPCCATQFCRHGIKTAFFTASCITSALRLDVTMSMKLQNDDFLGETALFATKFVRSISVASTGSR